MVEDILRIGGTFALQVGFIVFWYYVISRTGSF
jgi:uncharacterized protein YjeT (DUF2065 family)